MRVLITGACGFIGSHLAKKCLELGWETFGVDNLGGGSVEALERLGVDYMIPPGFLSEIPNRENFYNKYKKHLFLHLNNFEDREILDMVSEGFFDTVFHLAAIPRVHYSMLHPTQTAMNNVVASSALVEAIRNTDSRLVFSSSSSVYGGLSDFPTKESSNKRPISPYALQKSYVEDLLRMLEINSISLRYFNVFGPNQMGGSPYSTVISAWFYNCTNGLDMRLDGDGLQSRDLCYIDNVVNANILAAQSDKDLRGEVVNVACGDNVVLKDILDYFLKEFPECKFYSEKERPGDVKKSHACVQLAKELIGYEPQVEFWEGMEKTKEWWNNYAKKKV